MCIRDREFTLTYETPGGVLPENDVQAYAVTDDTLTLPTPTRCLLYTSSTDLLDADGIAAAIAQDDSLSWKTSGTGTYIYVKQDYGWHQVAVRDLENPENLYTAMVLSLIHISISGRP